LKSDATGDEIDLASGSAPVNDVYNARNEKVCRPQLHAITIIILLIDVASMIPP